MTFGEWWKTREQKYGCVEDAGPRTAAHDAWNAAVAEAWRTMSTDPAREAARLACDMCHCCGEQRHDGGDPCVSCASAVTKEREVILALQPPEKRTISGNPSFVAGVRAGWSDCLNAIRARTP